ncbi:MAG TPA: hypothetical protein VHO07_09010, partial [Streptosporangiaceae bacterium]|nr:hypothetical protein [Streptosporangiaceae bacterium]
MASLTCGNTLRVTLDLRRRITASGGATIRDIEHKGRLNAQAQKLADEFQAVGDAITAAGLAYAKLKGKKLDAEFIGLSFKVANEEDLSSYVETNLQKPRPI